MFRARKIICYIYDLCIQGVARKFSEGLKCKKCLLKSRKLTPQAKIFLKNYNNGGSLGFLNIFSQIFGKNMRGNQEGNFFVFQRGAIASVSSLATPLMCIINREQYFNKNSCSILLFLYTEAYPFEFYFHFIVIFCIQMTIIFSIYYLY